MGHWPRECRQKRDSSSKPSTSTASQSKSSRKESGAAYVAQEASVPAAQPEFVASAGCQQTLVQQFKQRFTTQHEVSSQSMEQPASEIFLVSSPGFAVLDSGCGKTIIGGRTLKQFQRLWQDDGRYSPKFKSETNFFKFGNGDRETITFTVIMPVGLAGRFGTVQAAVVQGDAPLLLLRPALKRLGATIDFHADRLQLFHGAVDLNLKPNAAGQYIIDVLDFPKNAIDIEAHVVTKQDEPRDEVPVSTEGIDPQCRPPDNDGSPHNPPDKVYNYISLRITCPCLVPPPQKVCPVLASPSLVMRSKGFLPAKSKVVSPRNSSVALGNR